MALFIFTLVAFSLVMALDSAVDAATERNEVEAAIRGLENQLALLHAAPISPVDKDLPDDKSGILYRLKIEQEQQLKDQKGQLLTGYYRVTLTAKWQSSNGEKEDRSVSELIYQP